MSSSKITLSLAVIGAVLSAYALYVEYKVAHKPPEEEFSALCDIQALKASCSSVFQLPEGRMLSYFGFVPEGHFLDIPNAALGIAFYIGWPFWPKLGLAMNFIIVSLALSSSMFMATRLIMLKELCVLCISCHLINSWLWWTTFCTTFRRSSCQELKDGKAKIKRV